MDKVSDGYCDTAIENKLAELKILQVSDFDIIRALNRAILKLQHAEWKKKEGK